ncbi:hypothetical protein D1BOALGB6SA_10283 [Olavius sp. associated proteobacterium Delta 1]|nr:hypothetical protein D1BOALGB6SA_10283 [Olavius sp. associated proteobacterium Delta 1]
MAEYIITIVATVLFLIVFTVYMTYYNNSGLKVVEDWAKKEGYKIINSELRWVKTGPFFWSWTSRHQRVFLVTLETDDGKHSKAWIRVAAIF